MAARVQESARETLFRVNEELTICDRTNGVAKGIFSVKETQEYREKHPGQRAYEIFVGDKKVSQLSRGLFFVGSKKFTFERVRSFVQLTEEDGEGVCTLYIGPRRFVDLHGKVRAVVAFPYLPCEPTKGEVVTKFQLFKEEFPTFRARSVVYNRHGIAVFGETRGSVEHEFYWEKPGEVGLRRIECSSIYTDSYTQFARADDDSVWFSYDYPASCCCRDRVYLLNGEKAKHLDV